MGRIGQLREQANQTFAMIKTGSHQKRKYRIHAVSGFINAMYACTTVPPNWYGLKQKHVTDVISYWRKRNLTDDSIRMYLAELRYFLQAINHPISEIDNKSLGLNRAKETQKIAFNEDCLQKVSNPMVLLIIRLQTEFGLTLSEAFCFCPDLHARADYLMLSRDMTNNSSDRTIQIYSKNQKDLIEFAKNIIDMNSDPVKQYGYDGLRDSYRNEVKKAGLTPSVNYRYVYARNRLENLLQSQSKTQAIEIILDEMGISKRALRRYLNEQYKIKKC